MRHSKDHSLGTCPTRMDSNWFAAFYSPYQTTESFGNREKRRRLVDWVECHWHVSRFLAKIGIDRLRFNGADSDTLTHHSHHLGFHLTAALILLILGCFACLFVKFISHSNYCGP